MNDPDKQTVVESQDCHLRPVVQRLVDALRKQRQVEDDQSRIADLQQDAFNEELLFVDIFNRSVGVFLVFDVRKSNGEGLGAKFLITQIEKKRMPITRMAP